MEITRDEYGRWRNDPVTKEIYQILRERMAKIAHALAAGGALIDKDNAVAVGRYKEIDDLLTMEYDDMKEG